MKAAASKPVANCLNCGAEISFANSPAIDQRITCPKCGDVHKVVGLDPLRLEWAWEDLLEGPEFSVRSWRFRGKR
jgi:lysine biosynthesis protein LysW